ncbi:leucine rich repeat protein [Penicillium brasilianum]|uniref:Leucine rich repeat protein n=1 Tax=Penicillium brasilianum TaxID=104259 RepID=A0A1S9RZR5_PENBI|nr:leucine rich repeat protein [Penicillium brasilianum]
MASLSTLSATPPPIKPINPRLSTSACVDQHSRDSSPSSCCDTPDGSRSSSSRRPSFGSIKEDVDGIAQSFVDTHHVPSPKESPKPQVSEMQQTPDFCCPCGGFLGWKQIRLGGKSLSRSYGDLRNLGSMQAKGWAWETTQSGRELVPPKAPVVVERASPPPGTSSLEKLAPEVLDQIISYLAIDLPPNGYTPRNVDLVSCLLTSRTLHAATLSVLYRNMTFPHSIIFSKALNHMSSYPALGTLVRRLDFSHFTSVGLGRTKQMNAEIQNLTSRTLLKCLDLLPNLKECLLQEHLEGDLSVDVVRKLFMGLPNLRAVDFCGCSTQSFSQVFTEALTAGPALAMSLPNLKRLSLHECSTIQAPIFDLLLSRLTNLTHLDLTHTQVNDSALLAIPETARITHLSLSRCIRLRSSALVEFLTTHPAVCESLVYLNLLTDPTRFRLLEEDDVTALLPRLPDTLRSLNLGGAKITSEHVPLLIPLTKHLEELGLSSADLSVKDVNSLFTRPRENGAEPNAAPSTLCYLDLAKVPQMTIGAIFNTSTCLLLSDHSYPLQVIEFSDKIITPLRERAKTQRASVGWTVRDLGRRGWYVRDPASMPNEPIDDGSRSWKMGARWWGMRKIPMAVGDVGGIYGHYMFKK